MMQAWREQWNLWLLALCFFSRIPVPANLGYSPARLNKASRYFTLVGWLLALLLVLVTELLAPVLPQPALVLVVMVASLMLTGAFHEDGLADTADGLGGGLDIEHKLTIMQDSRLGSYGACALMMALLSKFVLLTQLPDLALALLIAYPVSRALAFSLTYTLDYVRSDGKSKPLAQGRNGKDFAILWGSCLPLLWLLPDGLLIPLLATLVLMALVFTLWLKRQIGGYTGDCLGAAQQLTELVIYLLMVAQL